MAIKFFLLACLLMAAPCAYAVISCPQVNRRVGSCAGYVTAKTAKPTPACCAGVRSLNSQATTKPTRQAICNCLKDFANKIKGINDARVAGLPQQCGVSLPFTIGRTTNCNA
ncbi:non-specific lipid-transfer protein 3-like [Wolffia australiana]